MTDTAPAPTEQVGAGRVAAGTVAVSMPYWRTPTTVRAAVQAVLAQTHPDLLLYVVNDGDAETPPWPVLDDIDDPRLIRVELTDNRGRYFADACVLAATDAPWFAVHDADDLAEPTWLATLMDACEREGWVAAFAPQRVVRTDGSSYIEPTADPMRCQPGRLRHLAHHAGVYRTDAVRAVGGPHPGYRIGYDTLLPNLLALHGPVGAVEQVQYTRILRPGSLTTSPATRKGSQARRRARLNLDVLLSRAVAGGVSAVAADIGPELTARVAVTAAGIRDGEYTPGAGRNRPALVGVLHEPVWGGWALDRHTAEELAAYLDRAQPRTVVEAGSGMSTVLLAEYAARTGAAVTTLEHNPRYGRVTGQALAARGLTGRVDLVVADLVDVDTPAGPLPWYDAAAVTPHAVDLALVDGPPGSIGRHAALYALMPRMAPGARWEIWLDDADREGERACLDLWRGHYIFRDEYVPTPKGLVRITDATGVHPRTPVDASDVALTLLTGGRHDLLHDTVTALHDLAPGLWQSAFVAVVINGPDRATAELVDALPDVDHIARLPERLPIGPAVSAIHAVPAPRPFVLHLEDDWQVATCDTGWLDQARAVLRDPDIHQVRLRHRGDEVRREHMVTRRPLWWRPGPYNTTVAAAHYTLNPSLMRAEDVTRLWPATGEHAAARTFHALGWNVAQSTPGVFRHIGDGKSLRLGQRT